jgi:hypothetical protein
MKISLMTNPSTDTGFRAAAESALADGADSAADLQESLRDAYPRAAVADGIMERGMERWYAYREGHWVPSPEDW